MRLPFERQSFGFLLAVLLASTGALIAEEGKGKGKKGAAGAEKGEEGGGAGAAPEGEGTGNPENAVPDPKLKTAKDEEAFQKAKGLFEKEKYTEALAAFKKLKDQGKTPADKELLQNWTSGCQAGFQIQVARKQVEAGSFRLAYLTALGSHDLYQKTFMEPKLAALVEEIEGRAALVLENFDVPSDRYTEKFGKTFVDAKPLVFRGSHSLCWTSTKDGKGIQLRLTKEIPPRWGSFHSFMFWIKCEKAVDFQVIVRTEGGGTKGENKEDPDVFEMGFTPKGGRSWERAELELSKFHKHGSASWARVTDVVFQIESKTVFKFYLDQICLIRKDSKEASAGDTGDSGDDKDKKGAKKRKNTSPGKAKQTERKKDPPQE